jgi:hypothetical protein
VSEIQSVLNSLLIRARQVDPVMVTILQTITDELGRIGVIVDPVPTSTTKVSTGLTQPPEAAINGSYTLTTENVVLLWEAPTTESLFYEIRKGSSWSTANFVTITSNLSLYLDPLLEGTHTYLVRTLKNGVYAAAPLEIVVEIPPVGIVSITPSVVANAVTLSWTSPVSTFRIDYYRVFRDSVEIAQTSGTFYARSEQEAGTYTYSVVPVDLAGNEGPQADVTLVATGVTDYIFFDSRTSDLSGTIINGKVGNNKLIVGVDTAITYENHFTVNAWASPSAQVVGGYPLWLSPTEIIASYEEVFDFGVLISNVIVNLSWLTEIISGSFLYSLDVRVSDDGISYSTPFTTQSFYTTTVRFVKVKLTFTGNDDHAMLSFSELIVALNVKRENDGGFATGIGSDALGTVVEFNKDFVDVEAITVTPVSTTACFATFEFADLPFPTQFTVKIYDNAGIRITRDFRWNARGII